MVSYNKIVFSDADDIKNIPNFKKDEIGCLDSHSPFEILLGKEKAVFNHLGNKRFRAIINHNVHRYVNSSKKSTKTKLVRKIHDAMQKEGFRFLKKENLSWRDIDANDAREKVSHALRDRVREIRRPTKRSKKSSEEVYPMIISMAKVIQENQTLVKKGGIPFPPKVEWSKCLLPLPPTSKDEDAIIKTSSSDGNIILDLLCSVKASSQPPPSSDIRHEAINKRQRSMSADDSLFGGLANEIADAKFESSSFENGISNLVQESHQFVNELPMERIVICKESSDVLDQGFDSNDSNLSLNDLDYMSPMIVDNITRNNQESNSAKPDQNCSLSIPFGRLPGANKADSLW